MNETSIIKELLN